MKRILRTTAAACFGAVVSCAAMAADNPCATPEIARGVLEGFNHLEEPRIAIDMLDVVTLKYDAASQSVTCHARFLLQSGSIEGTYTQRPNVAGDMISGFQPGALVTPPPPATAAAPWPGAKPGGFQPTGAPGKPERDAAEPHYKGWWVQLGALTPELATADQSDAIQKRAAGCGLRVANDLSAKFQGFRPGYKVFFVGPFQSRDAADRTAVVARRCVPDAYVKYGEYLGE
jgi:hypothetical protein